MQVNPALGSRLFAISENSDFEVFVDENDPLNINLYDKKNDYVFYPTRPVDEVTAQYESFMEKFGRHPFLWMFGIGNGLFVKMICNLGKRIFLFEPEAELLYVALNLFDFSEEIRTKRLQLFLLENVNFNTLNALCVQGDIKVFLKTYSLEVTHPYYFQYYPEDIKKLNSEFVEVIKDVIAKEGNDANDSLIGLDHHLHHIPAMLASYPLQNLKKKRNTDHAVIVSTGPSLSKQLPLLKEYQDFITILCIDASLPILQREGIRPDFVFSLERMEPTAKFYENLDRSLLQETIFMPTSIVHPKLIEHIRGLRQAINMRPFGYTKAFHMDRWGYLGLGMSAANMAFDFAYTCRFKTITLIGQDLAFAPDGTTHSKGAVYGETEEYYLKKPALYVKGYYEESVKTTQTWIWFLNTFKRDIPKVTEDGIKVYNCTEGGAYIEGAEHIPFHEFLQTVTKTPKRPIDCQTISESSRLHKLRRVKILLSLYIERLTAIQKRVESVFLDVMETIETLEKFNKEERLEEIDFDELAQTINKIDTIKELYETDRTLMKFGNITNPFIINAELELGCIMVRPSETEIEKKVKMIDWIYEHKSWLFFLAGAIENILYILNKHHKETFAKF